ncbi:MAG: transposase [Runella sp.]
MKKSRFSESQRKAIVLAGENGTESIEKLCEKHQISPTTYYKWKQEIRNSLDEDKKRLQALEKENIRLKKMYLDVQLEKEILSDAVSMLKKMQAQSKKML